MRYIAILNYGAYKLEIHTMPDTCTPKEFIQENLMPENPRKYKTLDYMVLENLSDIKFM